MNRKEKPDRTGDAVTRENMAKFQAERQDLETELLDEVLKSRSTAWRLAGGLFALTVIAFGITGLVIHRYSQPLPTNFMVAQADGQYVRMTTMPEATSLGQQTDIYWASQFIIHYETYDYFNQQTHYDAVGLMASPDVADEWRKARYTGDKALDKVLGDSQMDRVTINSRYVDAAHGVATIRYTKQTKFKSRPLPEPPKHYIANIGYNYKKTLLTAAQRDINPAGYQVMSIDIHEESIGNGG
ncbi:type IV secretion system protein [Pseudomonas sp. Marseille-Q5115]|uniref:type IV secretion system protein n=1 Tax=Pseudomonas sp. Marseille-Q5115 TaxID=2866593 RepID=UPI001CE45B6B|nr:type IV secretion system protein [Pseudomonas sp. Marseille-Q5115]